MALFMIERICRGVGKTPLPERLSGPVVDINNASWCQKLGLISFLSEGTSERHICLYEREKKRSGPSGKAARAAPGFLRIIVMREP